MVRDATGHNNQNLPNQGRTRYEELCMRRFGLLDRGPRLSRFTGVLDRRIRRGLNFPTFMHSNGLERTLAVETGDDIAALVL